MVGTGLRGGSGAVGDFSSKQPVSKLIFSARAFLFQATSVLFMCLSPFVVLSSGVFMDHRTSFAVRAHKWHLMRQFVYEVVACQNLVTYQTLNGVRRWPRYGGLLSSSGK